jgi:hypothetical protein
MLELRKDIFADERDDNLKEVGQPTQRQDILGHVTGTSPYYDDHRFANLLHLKLLRSPHAHARIRSIDDAAAARAPGVKRIIRGADVPVNLNTLLSLIQFGKDDEPSLATDVVRYKGEPILAIVATSERAAQEALAMVRVSYDPLPAVFVGGLKPEGRSGMPPIRKTPLNTTGSTIIRSCALATWTRVSRRPKSCSRIAIRCRRSSTLRPRPTARSRCRTPTAASSSTPRRRRCSSRSTPRPRSTPCNRTNCISSAAPSAAASAERSTP